MGKRSFQNDEGPSQRQLRVGEIVRRALAEALTRGDHREMELLDVSITVTEVRLSPDLKIATAYVMPLGGAGADGVIKALARAKPDLRRAVARGSALKFSPDLRFRLDETFDQFDETRRLLSNPVVQGDVRRPGAEVPDED